jgi:hypothetical protein
MGCGFRRRIASTSCRNHRDNPSGVTASPGPAVSQRASDATHPVLGVGRRSRAHTNAILGHIAEKGYRSVMRQMDRATRRAKIVLRGFWWLMLAGIGAPVSAFRLIICAGVRVTLTRP